MIVVHASDLHLDSPLRGLRAYEGLPIDAFRLSSRRALQNLVSLCVEENARLLLIAGDLVDASGYDHKTGLFLVKELLRLRDVGCRVAFVHGNHDAPSRVMRTLLLPDGVKCLSSEAPETCIFEDLGIAVHGQSYPERAVLTDLASAYPPSIPGLLNFGLLHTAAEGSLHHDPYAPCSRRSLYAHGYDYWALGHVHARQVLNDAPWVVFPGNLQARSFLESGPKGATVIRLDGEQIVSVEPRPLDVVRFGTCTVSIPDGARLEHMGDAVTTELTHRARASGARALVVRLVLRGSTALAETLFRHAPERRLATLRVAASRVEAPVWLDRVWARFDGEKRHAAGADPCDERHAV